MVLLQLLSVLGLRPSLDLIPASRGLKLRLRDRVILPVVAIMLFALIAWAVVLHGIANGFWWAWLAGAVGIVAVNLWHVRRDTVIEFDRAGGWVHEGPQPVGRLSDVQAVLQTTGWAVWLGWRPALWLQFRSETGQPMMWAIPRVPAELAAVLGAQLAVALGGPFAGGR
jgi:hypothetical protein